MQRVIASVLLAAGVLVLAGAGWALLAAGGLVWAADERSVGWLVDRRDRAMGWWRASRATLRGMPRRSVAGGAMALGVAVVPVGAAVEWSSGVALVVLGGLLIAFSLVSGWGA